MNENSSLSSNFWANFRQILVLPKWAKVFLVILTALAAVGLGTAFSLKIWAADKVDSGEIVLKGIDKGAQTRILKAEQFGEQEIKAFLQRLDAKNATPSPEFKAKEGSQGAQNSVVPSKFAYQNRLYFARLDFLLRSKVIAYIDIQGISWAEGVDKNAITNISSHNRWVKFSTTQDLISQGFNEKNLGKVEYKMDFSPFFKTIIKYYLIIALCFYALLVLFQATFGTTKFKQISSYLSQTPLPSALWQGYKNINPLYRHTFWIVFIAMNLVFGFHTVQFLWGNHDWAQSLIASRLGLGRLRADTLTALLAGCFKANKCYLYLTMS